MNDAPGWFARCIGRDRKRRGSSFLLAFLCVASACLNAHAHDTGFGHTRRTIYIALDGETVVVEYRMTLAPEEALVEMTLMDKDRDGRVSAAERQAFFQERGGQLAAGLHCRVHEQRTPLKFQDFRLDQALTQTYRCHLSAPAGPIMLEDRNFAYKPGLVRVQGGPGITVELAQPTDLSHADRVQLKVTRVGK